MVRVVCSNRSVAEEGRERGWGLTYFVEVEGELAGDGTVEARLQERGPVLAQDVLAASVLLQHTHNNMLVTRYTTTQAQMEMFGWIGLHLFLAAVVFLKYIVDAEHVR